MSAWATLCSEDEIELWCVYFMDKTDEDVQVSAGTLNVLGDRGIKLGLRIYPPTKENEQRIEL